MSESHHPPLKASSIITTRDHYRLIWENAIEGIYLRELRGPLISLNPALVAMFGYDSEEEMIAMTTAEKTYARQMKYKEVVTILEEKGEIVGHEIELLRKDGSRFWGQLTSRKFIDRETGAILLEGSILDISEKKQMERQFQFLADTVSDCIYTHDQDGVLLSVNPAAARGLGSEPESLIGKSILEFMPEFNRKRFYTDFLPEIIRTGEAKGLLVLKKPDGGEQYLEFSSVLKKESGDKVLISGIGRFVTERIKAERELLAVKEKLVQAQKMEAMSELTRGITHDFNNLLQTIIQPLQMAQESESLDSQGRRYLDIAKISAERSAELVRQLMTFSRRVEPRFERVSLPDIVDQAVDRLIDQMPQGISVRTRHAGEKSSVNIDASQVVQALMNLGENAFEAMSDGGSLIFETWTVLPGGDWPYADVPQGRYAVVSASDTGKGIAREHRKKIYEPFFTTKEPGRGPGLGLSMAYGISQTHRAYITCDSSPGKGSRFSLFFPLADGAYVPDGLADAVGTGLAGKCVLLADDEIYIREIVSQVLTLAGCQVIEASNGQEALAIYAEKRMEIDLLILDVTMPVMGGGGCMKEVLDYNPDARIIIATESSDMDTLERLVAMGARGIIAKPFTSAELLKEAGRVMAADIR